MIENWTEKPSGGRFLYERHGNYGDSEASFRYDALKLGSQQVGPDETVQVSINISNTGQRTGKESVQPYIRAGPLER